MNTAIIITAIVIIFLVAKSRYEATVGVRKLHARLKKEWGDVPRQVYSSEKLISIRKYYEKYSNIESDIDDITWNDLNMDQIYMTMNNTASSLGEEYLYYILRKPQYDKSTLEEREALLRFFAKETTKRVKIQEIFTQMGKVKDISLYEYMSRIDSVPREGNIVHYFMLLVMCSAIALIFYNPAIGIFTLIIAGVTNIFKYYKRKMEIERYFTVISYIIRMLAAINRLEKCDFKEIDRYREVMTRTAKVFRNFKRGARLVASKRPNGDMADMVIDYIRMLFHFDLIKFNNMVRTFENNKDDIDDLFATIGLLDAMMAAASFRELMGEYCVPELERTNRPYFHAEEIYHPMLNDPVKATISETRCVLITGSNASGKSTFIKNLAINAILAQTINTCLAKSYKASYFKIASSMALTDNLQNDESYYIVEIKSLKRIIDRMSDDVPTLCFIDEVLRGTNTLERIAASSQILYNFARSNAMCFAATHDIELTYILEGVYSNYHFQEEIVGDDIIFDYNLYEGRTQSRNAIKLLGMMGYSEGIIGDAMEMVEGFLKNGEWRMQSWTR